MMGMYASMPKMGVLFYEDRSDGFGSTTNTKIEFKITTMPFLMYIIPR